MRSITFTAQAEQHELIDGLIQSGQYRDENEAISAALKLLEGRSAARLKRLRSMIDEGLESGPAESVSEAEFLKECRKS
jgi:putative addiction module CopG family antidote